MNTMSFAGIDTKSLPARGVWIEITTYNSTFKCVGVAPRKGSVD